MAKLTALKCPNCGGAVSISPGAGSATCSYCDTNLVVGEPTLTPTAPATPTTVEAPTLSPPEQVTQSTPAVVPLPSLQPALNPLAIIGLVIALILPPMGLVILWIASYQIGQSKGWGTGMEFVRIGYLAALAVAVMWLFVLC